METLTLVQSMIRGFVAGKMINCTVRSSPAGLTLPAGQYLLRPAANNPVYGLVMSIEPIAPGGLGLSAMKYGTGPVGVWHKVEVGNKSVLPAGLKMAPASKVDAPAGLKMAPASKVDAPAGLKMAPASKVDAPAIKFDAPTSPRAGAILMSDRPIAGNCLVVTLGFGDLVDAVQRAGGVTLIVT